MTAVIENRIGGRWVSSTHQLESLNPSDLREVVARVSQASSTDAADAMEAAAAAFGAWRRLPGLQRAEILSRAAGLLTDRRKDIAEDLAREIGKTVSEASVEVTKSADFFDYYAGTARMPVGDLLNDGRLDTLTMSRAEPVGVVVAITPWNDPILTPARKLAPALVAGNCVVLKPAGESPVAAAHLVNALVDEGLPDGVLNVVTGDVATVVSPLLGHPALAALTFTGSTAVGYQLQKQLAGRPVRVQTELGGKNAAAVLADANLDVAVAAIVDGGFKQAGQRCTATSRVVVQEEIYDEFLARLIAAVERLQLGSAVDQSTTMGPVVSEARLTAIVRHVDDARAEGGRVATGGSRPTDGRLQHGCYLEPTVITDVHRQMRLWREEVFGPVIAVRSASSFDQVVEAVNDSVYGLSASLFTRDLVAANRFIEQVDVGQVSVNLPTSGWDVHMPFGGFKDSGSAFKEQGLAGLQFYTRLKTAAVHFGV